MRNRIVGKEEREVECEKERAKTMEHHRPTNRLCFALGEMEVETESVTTKYVKRSGKFPGDLGWSLPPSPTGDGGEWDTEEEECTERNELLRQIYCVVCPTVPPSRTGRSKKGCWEMWREGRKTRTISFAFIVRRR